MKVKDIWFLIKETFSEWSEDKVTRLAAALSYFTVFSLAPFLLIIIAVAGFFWGQEAVQGEVVGQIGGLVGEEGAQLVEAMLAAAYDPGASLIATGFSIGLLLFGASGLFGQLQDALNVIWEVQPKPGRGILATIKDRFISFTMVLGVAFLLLVSLVLSAALAALQRYFGGLIPVPEIIVQIVNLAISLGVITLLFALMFKILPDAEIAWSDVWLGALVTAVLFTIGKELIGLYLGQAAVGSAYGAAGSLVIILLWVFYSAQILFLGAEFTQVYANHFGSRIVPAENAVPVTEEARARQGMPHKETIDAEQADQQNRSEPAGERVAEREEEIRGLLEPPFSPAGKSIAALGGILLALISFVGTSLMMRRRG